MAKRSLPASDGALLGWSAAFAAKVAIDPQSYGVSQEQSDALVAAQAAFAAAMRVAAQPITRTQVAVLAKNNSRETLRRLAGQLASVVQNQPGLSDGVKCELGVAVRAVPTAIGAPTAKPLVVPLGVSGRTVHLRVDDAEVQRRGRPQGCVGLLLYSYVGEQPPEAIHDWRFEGASSTSLLDVTFDTLPAAGEKAWFAAQWLSPRLEAGPLSNPAYAHLSVGTRLLARGMRRAA